MSIVKVSDWLASTTRGRVWAVMAYEQLATDVDMSEELELSVLEGGRGAKNIFNLEWDAHLSSSGN